MYTYFVAWYNIFVDRTDVSGSAAVTRPGTVRGHRSRRCPVAGQPAAALESSPTSRPAASQRCTSRLVVQLPSVPLCHRHAGPSRCAQYVLSSHVWNVSAVAHAVCDGAGWDGDRHYSDPATGLGCIVADPRAGFVLAPVSYFGSLATSLPSFLARGPHPLQIAMQSGSLAGGRS